MDTIGMGYYWMGITHCEFILTRTCFRYYRTLQSHCSRYREYIIIAKPTATRKLLMRTPVSSDTWSS